MELLLSARECGNVAESSQNPSRQATVQFIKSTIHPGMPDFGLIETHGNLVFRYNAFNSGFIAFKRDKSFSRD